MNRPPTITPYKDRTDLLRVRDLFYKNPEDYASIKSAVDTVTLWQTRGKLPHAVNATAWIVSAMLECFTSFLTNNFDQKFSKRSLPMDRISSSEDYVLRNAYSMALVRFVNGILDPYQQGSFAIALLTLAKDIGLPYYFVEIRHWATHEHLPSLEILKATGQKALNWLYERFWLPLDLFVEVKNSIENVTHKISSKAEVVSSLREYRSFMKRQTTKYISEKKGEVQDFQDFEKLKSMSEDEHQSYHLIRLLALKKALLKDISFTSILKSYAPLLENLGSSFLLRLMFALLLESQIALSESPKGNTENFQNCTMEDWLEYFVPRIMQGTFPFELHKHKYSCKTDVLDSLENYIGILDRKNDYLNILRMLSKTGPGKRKFVKFPLLDEVLSSPTTLPLLDNTSPQDKFEEIPISKRRKKSCQIFEDTVSWKLYPFGVNRTA